MPDRCKRKWIADLPIVLRRWRGALGRLARALVLVWLAGGSLWSTANASESRPAAATRPAAGPAGGSFPAPRPGTEADDSTRAVALADAGTGEVAAVASAEVSPLPVPASGPVPVRFLPRPYAPELVIQRFRLGAKVSEFMVVLHAPGLEGVRLRTPAGQIISADNIWRVGRWQAGQQLSVISLDWSAAGEWLVLGPQQVAVDVIVDPMLAPVSTPDTVAAGQPAELRWQLQAAGRALDLASLAELVVASARIVDERGAITDLAYRFGSNGIVSLTVPAQAAGVLTVQTDIWLATFGQHVIHRLAIVPEPVVQVLGRRAAPLLVVRVPDAGLDTRATRATLDILSSEGKRHVVVGRREADGSFRLPVPLGALGERPARARVVLGIDGMTRGRQPWHAPSRLVTLGSQGTVATHVLDDGPDEAAPAPTDAAAGRDGEHTGRAPAQAEGTSAGHAGQPAGNAGNRSAEGAFAHWLSFVLHRSGHGPGAWHYAALGVANLFLLALLLMRHRQKLRALKDRSGSATAPGGTGGAAAERTAAVSATAIAMATETGSAAAAVAGDDFTSPLNSGTDPQAPGPRSADGAPEPEAPDERLLEGLGVEALGSLAALAESQSEARDRKRTGGAVDGGHADEPERGTGEDDVDAAA